MEKLTDLWNNHRTFVIIVGLILLPITIAILVIKFYMTSNVKAAEASLNTAQKTDDGLKAQEDGLKKEADQAVNEADKAAQRIEDRHNEGAVDLDWNTKRKD
jgi:uncharacterized protein YoxC